jgi:hypothetical protein
MISIISENFKCSKYKTSRALQYRMTADSPLSFQQPDCFYVLPEHYVDSHFVLSGMSFNFLEE